jgi:hypothetical protein
MNMFSRIWVQRQILGSTPYTNKSGGSQPWHGHESLSDFQCCRIFDRNKKVTKTMVIRFIELLFTVLYPAQDFFTWKFSLCLALKAFEQRGIFIVPHLLWQGDFFRSYWLNHPIQSPLTTHKGKWKIYFNPDPQEFPAILWDTLHWINPDLFTVLFILISIPVTTVKAERSFSVMIQIKSYRSEIRNDRRASVGDSYLHVHNF